MAILDEAVSFLEEHESLAYGDSPWREPEPEDELHPINMDILFPSNYHGPGQAVGDNFIDPWEYEPDEDFEIQVSKALEEGKVSVSEDYSKFDKCAWYQPIHYYGYDWGIFIKEECVLNQAIEIARFAEPAALFKYAFTKKRPSTLQKSLIRASLFVYFLHEQYHHKIESFGFRLHVVNKTSAYLPYKKNVYRKTIGKDSQLEEALANADAYHRLSTNPYARWITAPVISATRSFLEATYPFHPPGYRKALDYLAKKVFLNAENKLKSQIKEATLHPSQPPQEWNLAPRLTQSFFNVKSNIWSVVKSGKKPGFPVTPYPSCSTKALVKLYESHGYEKIKNRGKGSHIKMKKSGAPTMIIPGSRKQLSPIVIKNALKALGNFNLNDLPQLLS